MNLYLFNPEADLALANNTEHYMPPAIIRQMALDLAILPAWYAEPGSAVLASSFYNDVFLRKIQKLLGLQVSLVTPAELFGLHDYQIVPWGWNLSLRNALLRKGFPEALVPSCEDLKLYREEASRTMLATRLSSIFQEPFCIGTSCNLYTLSDCRNYVEAACFSTHETMADRAVLPGCVLKAPWSGSGKGLNWCRNGFTPSIEGWCIRILREQGCVVASPIYDKVKDFAMEFYADGVGQVKFVGYSSFITNSSGAYVGNDLLSHAAFEYEWEHYLPVSCLWNIRSRLEQLLAIYAYKGYQGYLGVDMMVCRSSGGFLLHPAVEVNLRMNMGVVALMLQQSLLLPGCNGHFSIDYFPDHGSLLRQHQSDIQNFPLHVADGKVLSGYLSLTPVTIQGRYRASVWVTGAPSFP